MYLRIILPIHDLEEALFADILAGTLGRWQRPAFGNSAEKTVSISIGWSEPHYAFEPISDQYCPGSRAFVCGDDSFGPSVQSPDCRGGFDFTILFEESILAILPAACFLLLTPFRALRLLRRRIRVRRNALYVCKLAAIGAYIGLQLALLVLSTNPRVRTHISIASAALTFLSGLSLALLSHLEHSKSIRPSFLINFYLLLTVIFDATRVRTQWLAGVNDGVAGALTASLFVKGIVLVLEAGEKRSLLLGLDRHLSRESTSGMISRSSFWWLNSLLLSGFKNVLTMDNLPEIHEKLSSEHLAQQLQKSWDKCNQKRKHALANACTSSLRWEVLAIFVPKFCFIALTLSQNYLIQAAIRYVQEAAADDWNDGYGLVAAFGLVYISSAVTMGWSSHLTYRLMSMMRGQLVSIIYTKALTLPITGANESAAMTLMGTDVQSIAASFHLLLVDLIPSIVQLGVAIYLLYLQLGAVCIAPVIVSISGLFPPSPRYGFSALLTTAQVSTMLSSRLAGHVTSRQKRWYEAIQRRVNYTSEILGSMRNVKMLGLSEQMGKNIQSMREGEMKISSHFRKVQSMNVSLVNIPSIFNEFIIFAAYAIAAKVNGTGAFSVSQAITGLTALQLLSMPLANLLLAIPTGWASLGCFARIQDFLLQDSHIDQRSVNGSMDSSTSEFPDGSEALELGAVRGMGHDDSVRIEGSSFGWSESSPSIVKEVTATIQPKTDLTIVVGPVGCGKSTLLKGLLGETPESRGSLYVSSAHIAYCDQTPWVINGTIRHNIVGESEFESTWYQSVLKACALDIDLCRMPNGDQTIVGSQGVKLSGGQKQRLSIARAVYSRKPLAILDDVLSGLDSVTEDIVFQRVFGSTGLFRKTNTTVILATHSVKRLPHADLILALDHEGRVVEQGTFQKLSIAGNYIQSLQVKLEEQCHTEEQGAKIEELEKASKSGPSATVTDDMARKTGDWSTWKYYTRALGRWPLALFVGFITVNEVFIAVNNTWIKWWASSNETNSNHGLGYWLGLYALFCFLKGGGMVSAIAWLWVYICPRSGNNLHKSMLDAAMRAPMSFFANTETGILVNRFSQDIRLADIALPGSLINVSFQIGSCLVIVTMNIIAVSYFAVVLPFVCGVLYCIQSFYLRTSRQLRLLEIEANAPLFSHLIETSSGLATIRAFGWAQEYTSRNRRLLDESQKPFYLLFCVQRWLVLVLDLVVAGLAIILVGMAVALRSKLDAGFLGLALLGMMSLSHALTQLVQHYTMLETTLGAIARIKDFSENTPVEKSPEESDSPGSSWPSRGVLRFEGVSASYGKNAAPVLKDLTFSVEGGQKVGIVGRTGSGKSSCTLAIMRMIDIVSGSIVLDGEDLSTLTGSVIRERLNCLTQDPFLYPASIRSNADPLGKSTDEAIVEALQKVRLWSILQDKVSDKNRDIGGVLDTLMDSEFLSHGQRQLFCLSRAMLKPGKVLILDEPTSSVDTQTDEQMQGIIRSEFKDYTILMIAHRLSSLMDFDKVMVLDGGRLVELGRPTDLLKESNSAFAKMYYGSSLKS
ncbi:uncharacterized protein JN550_010371 [Neoarthrinium moseri]|uniref:uncharacterized protein n=1 Tax=Neoarthrinium moseri TaxID=1658444 RepID=UPI001FDCF4AE|nr:uncharacterized protein JN550_010371 [Neoarthrinium moseri]KAI1862215.1 hypothetical protein JN550_010371 [Neoarthrinium moseri]